MNEKGLLLVFSGPSGVGKDTLLQSLIKRYPELKLSISATTRSPRPGEEHGTDYFFLSRDEFVQLLSQDKMLEHAEYCGNFYGTPADPIEEWTAAGNDVILEIEVQGGVQVLQKCPDCVSIFILPPSLEVLEQRLRNRGTESEKTISERLRTAQKEIAGASQYGYVVINDDLDKAVDDIAAILCAEKHKNIRNKQWIERMLIHA